MAKVVYEKSPINRVKFIWPLIKITTPLLFKLSDHRGYQDADHVI